MFVAFLIEFYVLGPYYIYEIYEYSQIFMNIDKIRLISKEQYPFLLQQMKRPPEQMYVLGEIPSDNHKFLCVVGSRTHSQYGIDACKEIILGLRGSLVVIVSGLAVGIDSLAHEYALEAGLKTIAFPGSGLDKSVLSPRSRIDLAQRIVKSGGTLLSPFDMLQSPTDWTFPARNTLMAGISHAVLIVEGRKDSGTMITAAKAAILNRDLMVVPGSIFSDLSSGPNSLLREGAIAVSSAEDVLEALGIGRGNSNSDSRAVQNELGFLRLNSEEQRLLACLSYPKMRDELVAELNIEASTLGALLSSLELYGAVSDQDGIIVKLWKTDQGN